MWKAGTEGPAKLLVWMQPAKANVKSRLTSCLIYRGELLRNMLFIVQFEDKPGVGELRQQLLEKHFAFLDSRKDKVLVAGSVREIPSDRPLGGLWIVEADGEAEVREVFKDDPFWVNDLRASVRINRWVKAFPDRKTPI